MGGERVSSIPQSSKDWWNNLVETLPVDPEYKEFLLSLEVVKEGGKLTANTPEGRRELTFSSVSSMPVIGYKTYTSPAISVCVAVPGLAWEEITRQGLVDKTHWGEIEEI